MHPRVAALHPRLRRSHAGRASANLAVPALVIVTTFLAAVVPATDSDPTRVQQRAKIARQRRFVKRRQPAQVALPDRAGPREDAQQGILGRAQADAAQLLVIEPADRSRRLTQGAAKAGADTMLCCFSLILDVYAGTRRLSRCRWKRTRSDWFYSRWPVRP